MNIERVILSGGGTGGHIFPALAIANEIRNRYPSAEILFVGALGRMEMEKIPVAGYKIIGLPIIGFPRNFSLKMITFFMKLFKSVSLARKIVNDFKPQVVIGVGGYASGPLLWVAACERIPTIIQEQNSYAGITNKILGKKVNAICVAYNKMERFFPVDKIKFTGNPVRGNLVQNWPDTTEAFTYFGLNETDKVILITGGSLGARSINNAVLRNINLITKLDIQIIWQTGTLYYDKITEELKAIKSPNLQIHRFITRMDFAYQVADVVISRAGAGTISELCLLGKPSILVPSPNVAEDHQTKNALALVEKEAVVIIHDNEINEKLLPEAIELINDEIKRNKLSEQIKTMAKPNATKDIVSEVEKIMIHK
ncbi:MAG: undecaprenyldiphospho-muramoylpentapeptide beta-N-acetylglucosaminyltransferase [Bacteroidales bacterium]|jgi:UDP-N-acetylglucosamine--N-acetylmuramyl-(pentapeptide) pyrophosphoryl-undecaprenol N-acetylglucosamine transferase|nr:undecaprenyldiphospho-muramoylpentapeptide beta-N-acetylglucosaminyltransferase [Bacteroidales bacterium]